MKILQEIYYEIAKVLLEIKTNFSMQEFKNLQSLEDMVKYADTHLQKLGAGSSRVAYLLSNRYVLKLAIPAAADKGIGQNKGEVSVFTNPKAKNIVSAVYDYNPKYHWLISELARPVKSPQEFEQLAGISWNNFSTMIKNYKSWQEIINDQDAEYNDALAKMQNRINALPQGTKPPDILQNKINRLLNLKKELAAVSKNPILLGALSLITEVGLMPGDIEEWDHWAKTADGRLIIIDYGFTRDLVDLYKTKVA